MYPKKLHRQVICNWDEPIVQTKAGKLRGLITDGTYLFRGIRYAEAKRFHMPEPVTPWEGIKDAIVFGNVCPEIQTGIAHDEYFVPHYYFPQDENCQYLNVWTQSIEPGVKKPVMFWIHGGGYSSGSSIELYAYDGEELSRYGDVVVVSLNHRLNVLGFLDLSAYGEEYKYSGNVGMADVVAALQWVRDNIEAFGGDPDNVTIMGQSGGGGKVATLLQMPAADGLFHKAVIQSGMGNGTTNYMQEDARKLGAKVLEYAGIAPENIKELEEIPYYKLARAASKASAEFAGGDRRIGWSPVFDNDYYKGNPLSECGFRPETKHIPMIIGSNDGEMSGNTVSVVGQGGKNEWSDELKAKLFKEKFGDEADKAVELFKKAYPKKNTADLYMLDYSMRNGVTYYSKKRAEAGCAPIYAYLFNLEMPFLGGTLCWHNAEEAYMFHNAEYLESSYVPGVSEMLQDVMTSAWLSFAKTGDPNHVRMPFWYPVTPDTETTMIFNEEPGMAYDHDKELISLITAHAAGSPFGSFARGNRPLGGGPRSAL